MSFNFSKLYKGLCQDNNCEVEGLLRYVHFTEFIEANDNIGHKLISLGEKKKEGPSQNINSCHPLM